MVKLSWQVTVLYAIAMIICGAIIICGFFVEEAKEMRWYAITLLAALAGFGGGKAQTIWEIRKGNGDVRRTLPPTGQGRDSNNPSG